MATSSLPEHYALKRELRPGVLGVVLNVCAFLTQIPFFFSFMRVLAGLRPEIDTLSLKLEGGAQVLLGAGIVLFLIITTIVIHELVHGAFFWIIGKTRPVLGFRLFYAYAASPRMYFSKGAMLAIGLAPLVVISLVGIALCFVVPAAWLLPILFILVANASGAVGDIAFCGWLLLQPRGVRILDRGESMAVFTPSSKEEGFG